MATTTAEDRLVVGIDFGTTFSGVAAVYSAMPDAPDDIDVVKTWPGGNNATSDKVPSEITYGPPPTARNIQSTSNTTNPATAPAVNAWSFDSMQSSLAGNHPSAATEVRWGFQLRPEEERIRCMKLLLDPQQRLPSHINRTELNAQLQRVGKDAVTVVADYLKELWDHAYDVLERRYGKVFMAKTKIDVVLTVPAVWSEAAKDATQKAAQRAGMGENLHLISEPEAAAVYTLKSIQPNHLKKGNNFIVCDAGGGTVDLISYEIKQVNPLRIEESAEGTGGLCGAAVLNLAFEKYVRGKIGPAIFDDIRKRKPRSWQTAIKCFEDHVKRSFDPDAREDEEFNIPFPVNDGEAPGVDQGFLTLTSGEVKTFFMPIVNEILELVQAQMTRLETRGKSVNGIVLVGGFGQSNCLFKSLQARYRDRSPPPPYPGTTSTTAWSEQQFEVMQPKNAWSAVVRGAVLRGLEGVELVLSRRSRRHYGVKSSEDFDDAVHPAHKRTWDDLEEKWLATDQVIWYIRKGQTCSSKKPTQLPFYSEFADDNTRMHTVHLVVSDEFRPPTTHEAGPDAKTKVLCSLTVNLNPVPARFWKDHVNSSGVSYKTLSYVLGMRIDSGGLRFDLRVEDTVYGQVTATFN